MKHYYPSNSTEGFEFMDAWCKKCKKDSTLRKSNGKTECPILTRSVGCEEVEQWVYVDEVPTCTSFVHYQTKGNRKQRCPKNQMTLI